jgi:hypothetical protein
MVMLVPLTMYTLYLEDLLFYKLDQQETVVSSAWDFVHGDFRHGDQPHEIEQMVQRLTGQTYWDHTSAWNTYSNPGSDGSDAKHHQALAAHQCWLAQGGQQLACRSYGVGTGREIEPRYDLRGAGLIGCDAILGVQNYFLPEHFLGRAVAYSKRWEGKSGDAAIHTNAHSDAWTFPKETAAMVHDSWALNWLKNSYTGSPGPARGHNDIRTILDPSNHYRNDESEWNSWIAWVYQLEGRDAVDTAETFVDGLIDDEFLTDTAKDDGSGDDLMTPPLAYRENPSEDFGGFQPSGWADDRVEQTGNARQRSYMGMPDSTW